MSEHTASQRGFPVLEPQGPITRELSIEERFETLVNIYKLQYFATYRHIAKRFGWDAAIEIADEMAAEAIPHVTAGYKRKFGLPGEGVALIAQVLATEFQVEGGDVETIVETEDEAEYKVYCAFGNALQSGRFEEEWPITEGLCTRGCWGWTQRVADEAGGDLHVERHAWMGDGAECCHFSIRPRE